MRGFGSRLREARLDDRDAEIVVELLPAIEPAGDNRGIPVLVTAPVTRPDAVSSRRARCLRKTSGFSRHRANLWAWPQTS